MTYPRGALFAVLACALLAPDGLQRAAAQSATAPAKSAPPSAAAPKSQPQCDRAQFRLILDVGHTPEAPGALSARGVYEYEFNLRLAREIEQTLRERGFARTTLLTNSGEPPKELFTRVASANRAPAHLLLSIHHDAVPDSFLEDWEPEGAPLHFSDRFKGHSIFISYDNPDRAGSLMFARLLGLQLKAHGLQYTPHYTEAFMGRRRRVLVDAAAGVYRYDQLIVLRASRMPAVLLEAGLIINREEELLLNADEHRALIRAAAADAVEQFCAARLPLKRALVAAGSVPLPRKRGEVK